MRWERLFADLEAEFEAAAAEELSAEVADRTRREWARLRLVDRLRPAYGALVTVRLPHVGPVRGRVAALGPDWLLLGDGAGEVAGGRSAGEALVPLAGVLAVAGLGPRASEPGSEGPVAARLGLGHALRGLARNRAVVAVTLRDGTTLTGTFDRVGADFCELAEHGGAEARRAAAVRSVLVVPTDALLLVRALG